MAKKEKRIQDIYNLTPMQNGMLFHHLAAGESNVYFEQTVFIISGQLDARLLEESFRTIILRHDVLRTVFRSDKLERPQQFVLKNRKFDLHVADISQSPAEEQHNLLEEYKAGDSEKGFDPARDMLMRTALFKTGANRYRLVWSLHHILMDGWCLGIIIGELMQVYMALKEGSTPSLNPVIPYRRYIDWLDKQDNDEGLTYWREYLMGFDRSTGLPGKTTSNEEQRGYELKEMSLDLEGTIVSALGRTAQKAGTTISTLFQTAWGILLQCYNNCNDVVYGMVVSGRPPEIDGVESIVGLFINTVPIRIRTDEQATFAHLLNRIREESGPSKRHEHISLAEIQTNSELKSNLFDHIMVFENFPVEENVKKAGSNKRLGFQIEDMDSFEQTSYDLNILINPGDTFTVKFSYNSLVYSSRSIEAAAGYFQHILQQVANNPLMKAADIQLLMDTQKKRLLHNFNDTSADYPDTFTIMEMVEKQARKTPDRMAVTFKNTHTTYGKLMDGVGQLAALLRTHGVTAGSLVAVTTERCTELPTCILAILAAGGAYLPISTNSPWERSKYILEDSGSRLVLAPTSLSRPWGVEEPQETDIICLEEIDLLKGDAPDTSTKYGITNHESPEDFHTSATGTHMQSDRSDSSRNPAYAIYTSGSTGQPKGVLVEQRSVINRLNWMQRAYPIGGNDVILQKTPVVFDVSVWELFWWAFQGAALHLLEMGGESNPEALVEAIGKHRITTMHFVPSMLTAFLAHIKDARVYHRLSGLRQVFASGEALGEHQVIDFNSLLYDTNGTKLINLYGPTEATVDVS
ncbi:MAG: AMP-binding protein, partial [bacterium]|nr:AMP-binding protein [bacterium]